MKYQVLLYLLFWFIFISCSRPKVTEIHNDGNPSQDSTSLIRIEQEKTIYSGTKVTSTPIVSQVFDVNRNEYYILLDNDSLYFYNLETGCLSKTIDVSKAGKLTNYSGFCFTGNEVYAYNYTQGAILHRLDIGGNILKSWNIKDKSLAKYPVDPEATTVSPVLNNGKYILLSGSGHGQPDDATFENKPLSCIINLQTDSMKYGAGYPEQYRKGNFGGVYFNSIYHTVDKEGRFIYSHPADHYIYRYSPDLTSYERIYMGSRYIDKICSLEYSTLDIYKNKSLRIRYYLEQPSYANIIYDKYRDLYYRVAQQPLKGWVDGTSFVKPFSIIVMNSDSKIISETSVITDYNKLNLANMHITKDGLMIQKRNEDNSKIEFVLYE